MEAETRAATSALAREEARAGELRFERYYRDLQRVDGGGGPADWRALMRALHTPLPVAFRTSGLPSRAAEVSSALRDAAPLLEAVAAVRRFAVPRAWQLDGVDARALRQAVRYAPESPLAQLSRWLVEHSASGLIVRQELVSMVPVALLDLPHRPGARVLELCAAPGSKSTQALEALHAAGGGGYLVANEMDGTRTHVLAARCAALGPPCVSLAVTRHAAQTFPTPARGSEFDAVICDVPCSGDGTFRKYPDKWARYEAHLGRTLHARQLQILLRAAAVAAVGAHIAYSTCSLDPLEDEAVVSAALRAAGGALELEEAAPRLAGGVVTRAGLSTWAVPAEDLAGAHAAHADAARAGGAARFRSTMWPPAAGTADAAALRRCVRIFPPDNDSGGFFAALLRKARAWPEPAAGHSPPPPGPAAVPARRAARGPAPLRRLSAEAGAELLAAAPALRPLLAPPPAGAAADAAGPGLVLCARGSKRVYCLNERLAELLLEPPPAAAASGSARPATDDVAGAGLSAESQQPALVQVAVGVCVARRARATVSADMTAHSPWVTTRAGARLVASLATA